MKTIGERIKHLRVYYGMTQAELAKKVGYTSRSTIAKIETGNSDITSSKLIEIAKILRTNPEWLLGWKEKRPKYYGITLTNTKGKWVEYVVSEAEYIFFCKALNQLEKNRDEIYKELGIER